MPTALNALARPKSITFGTGLSSCSVTSRLLGFRSRWMIPFWCACCTAEQICTNRFRRSLMFSRQASQYSVSGRPLTSSITK